MLVKGFNNHELNEAFRVSPEIVCNYISALKRAYDMSEETNKQAIEKIRKLTKAIDDISNSERKTIVDLNEENIKLKKLSNITVEEIATIISEAGFLRGFYEEQERFYIAENIYKGIRGE